MTIPSVTVKSARFTGRHMLAIMCAFFGTIIGVNMLMAYYASASWSGILAKNTYVASQDFNLKAAEARKWAREGFKGKLTVEGDQMKYRLEGPAKTVDALQAVSAIFHRPVGEQQDFVLTLQRNADGIFVARHELAPGQWIADIAAIENSRTIFHEAMRIQIAGKAP